MQFPITIGLHRSRFLDGAIAIALTVISLVAWAFPGALAIRLAMLGFGISAAFFVWQQLKPRINALRLERNGDLSVQQISGDDFLPAEIQPSASVHPWLTVLRLKMIDQTIFPLTLTVDSLNAPDFRRLRVFLRWRVNSSDLSTPSED